MFFRLSRQSKVDRILLVSLSNVGDIVMTFPVFDAIRATFPKAEITIVVGPKGKPFFADNPHVHNVVVLDKKASWAEKRDWVRQLRATRFDLLVDLRNTMLPFLLRAVCATFPSVGMVRCHMKDKHLSRLKAVLPDPVQPLERYAGYLSTRDLKDVGYAVFGQEGYILCAPGAADQRKRWTEEGFAAVIRRLVGFHRRKVVVVGDRRERQHVERIVRQVPSGVINICGFTSLIELMGIVSRAALVITNDSGTMHLASYFNIPTVALFGPTDPFYYGPWSTHSVVVRKGQEMSSIAAEDVNIVVDRLLSRVDLK